MNFLIVEDEEQAAKRLSRLLSRVEPKAFIHGPVESVEEAVEWFRNHPEPDLAFFDIHLADGLSFEIGEREKLECPIIFTTAYDQYAVRAFKLNSVDYLLKPIEEVELGQAMEKFRKSFLNHPAKVLGEHWPVLRDDYTNRYKRRFVTKVGDKLLSVETDEVLFAFSENKGTYLKDTQGKKYLVDFSLEELESMLDPDVFFRLNRKYCARFEAVEEMLSYSNSRLKVTLRGHPDQDIVLSRDKTREFKSWIDR